MFREDKATQLAAYIVKKKGGRMKYMHLVKVMYEADREMLFHYGMPITFDAWCAMHCGPVLSNTYDCIRRKTSANYWSKYFSPSDSKYKITLEADPGTLSLSDAELYQADAAFQKFGNQDQFDVVKYMHENFPEWSDPGSSSAPMSYEHVLRSNGFSESDVDDMQEYLAVQQSMERLATPASI